MSNHPADLARALADLATGPPCSKAAAMRVMLPHIESALASDRATQSSIRQTLAAAGFNYSESEFRNALHRARKGRHAPGKTTAPPPPGTTTAMEIMNSLGSKFGKEAGFIEGKGPAGPMTVEMASAKIKELLADPVFAKADATGGHKEVKEMTDLHISVAGGNASCWMSRP